MTKTERKGPCNSQILNPSVADILAWFDNHSEADCWEWPRARSDYGYGRIRIKGKIHQTHRLVFEFINGPIPSGHYVCHKCDNPPCLNPKHLFCGTPQDNAIDKIKKGRAVYFNPTHCPQGHEYTPDNTYLHPSGKQCRQCVRNRAREYQRRRRGISV